MDLVGTFIGMCRIMKLYAICNIWSSIYGYLTIVSKQNTWLIQYWYSIFNWKTGISTRMELSTLYCVSFISICYFCICHWSIHVWYSASSLLVESESKLCTEKHISFPVFLAVVLKMQLNWSSIKGVQLEHRKVQPGNISILWYC